MSSANLKLGKLGAAVAIVLGLSLFKATRAYATPVGVIILAVWYFNWQRQGGRI